MRLRIRGPAGQSTVTLEDGVATIGNLREAIVAETGLTLFDVKYGYPPKPLLVFEEHPQTKVLTELDIKLNGEQLLVTRSEAAPIEGPSPTKPEQQTQPSVSTNAGSSSGKASSSQPALSGVPKSASPSSPTSDEGDMEPPQIFVPELGGNLVLRVMPDDNSCLFRAISSAVMSDIDAVTELRSIVAETINSDPTRFSRAILDNKTPSRYCRWIRQPDSWGGQVELLILSQHFQVEICSIDVQTLRVDTYNEGAALRCFVVYSGIHYDTIALSLLGMRPEDDVKQFEAPIKDEVLPKAIELCKRLQEMHYFTDTAGFQLRCNDCGTMLTGEREATKHASATGHYNFGEATAHDT